MQMFPARFLNQFLRPNRLTCIVNRYNHENKAVMVQDAFAVAAKKDKQTYLEMIKIFEGQDIRRRGHVEFIISALRHMEEFGVHKDLEVYKSILDVLPKGRFVPTNLFQAQFMHFPKQQNCALELLEQMEDNGVMPDIEMEDTLLNIFGRRGIPLRKYWRMMYWMPKFKHLSPWPLPQTMPNDALELAQLAIKRITSVDNDMEVTTFHTRDVEDALDRTWIVSAQCPTQITLLENEIAIRQKNPTEHEEPLLVRGAYKVYLRDQSVTYFTLLAPYRKKIIKDIDPDDIRQIVAPNVLGNSSVPALRETVHEQDDGTIIAVCATGTSSRDSLLSWIRLLEKNGCPELSKLPVVFTLTAPSADLVKSETKPAKNKKKR